MKNILVCLIILCGLTFISTVQAQSIQITNEHLYHVDGFVDYFDVDYLDFNITGDTGGDTMMIRYGVQHPNSTNFYYGPWYMVTGAFDFAGEIPCAWNGWTSHQDSYLVVAELRTYSYFTYGDLVTDDVAFFNHN